MWVLKDSKFQMHARFISLLVNFIHRNIYKFTNLRNIIEKEIQFDMRSNSNDCLFNNSSFTSRDKTKNKGG